MQWRTDPRIDHRMRIAALVDAAMGAPFDKPELIPWLGRSLLILERKRAAAELMTEAVARSPADAILWLLLARAQFGSGDHDSAAQAVETTLMLAPGLKEARLLRFRLLIATGAYEAAQTMTDIVTALPAFDPSLCQLQMRDEQGCAAIIAACDRVLHDSPGHTNAIYFKALALARLGRDDEARRLIDLDEAVRIIALPFDAAFCAALAAEIEANPTLTPDRRTTRGGLQTLRLDYPGATHIEALLSQLKDAAENYAARGDRWSAAAPREASRNSWAVIYGAQGRQLPHHHVEGWVSGVFYAAAPRAANGDYAGRLVLGEAPAPFGITDPPWGIRTGAPGPGRLVLFPSYVPHATEETGVTAPRISVAFDVVPAP